MPSAEKANQSAGIKAWRPSLVECLVILALITVLIALLLPQVKWASDGDLDLPVRVLVFDAATSKPISDAQVILFRGSPWLDEQFLADFHERFTPDMTDRSDPNSAMTDTDGQATVKFRFRTGASHERPAPHAHTSYVWLAVQAPGYGGAAVQLRQESMPTKQLKEQKELRVPIGLLLAN